MLDLGFDEEVAGIINHFSQQRQTLLFSATMPLEILEITSRFMQDPIRILVKRDELTLEGIKQFYIAVEREEWKLDALCDLYEMLTITQCIIYVNTRRKVDWLTEKMQGRDFTVSSSTKNVSQPVALDSVAARATTNSSGSTSAGAA